jgi:carbon starvation protein CstA
MIENERQIAFIGYGGMLMESFVAIMAMIGASVIHPGVYFAMNSSAGLIGTTAEQAAQVISSWGFVVTPAEIVQMSKDVGETTILSRTGGCEGLARISHTTKCIETPNQRKLLCSNNLARLAERPDANRVYRGFFWI